MRKIDIGRGRADGVGAHGAVGLRGHEQEGFGLPVELLQIEADRAIEGEEIGADRFARGIGDADAGEAERVLQRRVDQEFAEGIGEPRAATARVSPLAIFSPQRPATSMKRRYSQRLSAPASSMRICTRVSSASNTRGGAKWIGRPDLAQVAGGGVGAFRTGHAEAGDIALRVVEIMVADPGERQIGEHFVAVGQLVEGDGSRAAAIERSPLSTTPFERPVVPEV